MTLHPNPNVTEGDLPWLLTLDAPDWCWRQKRPVLKFLYIAIREQVSLRLVADLPNVPIDSVSHCAEVIRNAIRMCQSGPACSDTDRLHFFDDNNKVLLDASVDLSFDSWGIDTASDDHIRTFLDKLNATANSLIPTPSVRASGFRINPDGIGVVYWTGKSGIVYVLWPNSPFLKSLYLQSERDITNFGESLFGKQGHSFEKLRKLLDWHEGEWFDPPENFPLYSSYQTVQHDSVYIGTLPRVYESDAEEGKLYYGRMVACENKMACPEITKWTEHKDKIWLRINANTDNQDYTGPFENYLQAAQEAYRLFFD
jgi:hypothetical protein